MHFYADLMGFEFNQLFVDLDFLWLLEQTLLHANVSRIQGYFSFWMVNAINAFPLLSKESDKTH